MSIVIWNSQGLGSASTINELRTLCRSFDLQILFVLETKTCYNHISRLKYVLNFQVVFVDDVVGRSGGLALFGRVF